ncbi:hypothetical protein TNCV_790661 [Trichonephila clavipes]|nr:hypothetical protein TNCV_790661 [Trichonephila clavipes]
MWESVRGAKAKLVTQPILFAPDFATEFILQTDASECYMKGNTRNRWRDGPVCPAADKELWRLGPDSSRVLACYAPIGRGRSRETLLTGE